jgi:hypothetical protein
MVARYRDGIVQEVWITPDWTSSYLEREEELYIHSTDELYPISV